MRTRLLPNFLVSTELLLCFILGYQPMKASSESVFLVLLACSVGLGLLSHPVTAQTLCGTTFFSALVQLMPCRPAVAPFSPAPPSEACCNAVRALGQPCLCFIANGPPMTGVDRSVALQLPNKCNANFASCNAV